MIILNLLLLGLLLGSLYGLIGIGFSMVFATTSILNLMHGDMLIMSAYIALSVVWLGVEPLMTILVVFPAIFCLSFILFYFFLRRYLRLGSDLIFLIVLGLSMAIENSLQVIYGTTPRSLAPYTWYGSLGLDLKIVVLPAIYIIAFAVSLITTLALYWFLKNTYIGKAIRATSNDLLGAEIVGIQSSIVMAIAFGLASAIAAIGGPILGLSMSFDAYSGLTFTLISFGILVLGGAGSIRGAFIGGEILGLAQILSSYYLGPAYQFMMSYIVILIVLAVKPTGLLGGRV
ncbi:MAG: branched-chain amino acid ABC transporter permease [Candidatus Bathyarchaeia archaeon]